jgi:signal peptidase II
MKLNKGTKAVLLILSVLILDQVVKILIKTSMTIGQSYHVLGNWFQIRFIENPGMAFGLGIPGELGKPVLTIFRIIAVIIIGWYLRQLAKKNAPTGLVLCVALIMAGAMGNIFDSLFYGLLFNESTYFSVASLLPSGGGYAPMLYGRVVDMLYFPIIQGHFPSWFPWHAGEEFIFFRPIFNIADSSISIGIIWILLFQKRYFKEDAAKAKAQEEAAAEADKGNG